MNQDKPSETIAPGPWPRSAGDATVPDATRTVTSADLLGARRALMIEHNGSVYALRVTSKGKLILTK